MNNGQVSEAEKLDTDIVIIGGGGAGLAAAVAAAENGAKVILLEKRGLGGNTALALGLFGADSPVQRRLHIDIPKDELFNIAMSYSHWKINPRIFRAFVDKSGDTIRWLQEKGVQLSDCPSLYIGQPYRTFHTLEKFEKKWGGPVIVKMLRRECENLGVQLFLRCPANKILTDNKGAATGVLATMEGKELKVTAKSVIIATGGYGGNKTLLKKYYLSYNENLRHVGVPNKGDGLQMAIEIGAATEGLGLLLMHHHIFPGSKQVDAFAQEPYPIWVNKKGERFANETITSPPEVGNAIDRQPDKCIYVLCDERMTRQVIEDGLLASRAIPAGFRSGSKIPDLGRELQLQADKGGVKISDSWNEIARWIGATYEVLKATIEEYNSFCDRGHDEIFGKDWRYLQALRTPPYYAITCYPRFLTTIGGIKINHRMEVLDHEDNPIRGLYAVGDTAGGWESDTYCMSLPGSALGFAINSGRIAGENAAKKCTGR